MRRLALGLLLLAILGGGFPREAFAQIPASLAAPSPAQSESAKETLARVQPSVVQLKGFFGANTAQAFHGTGFAVAPGGLFITNYHVVAEKVQYPDKYRLEYRTVDGTTGPVTVLGVDVRHDLALVRATNYAPAPLELQTNPGSRGERAYSVGFPLDVGLTITEGISNGRIEDSFGQRIHYSGALNSGMSGGPALNAERQVIGVNVAGYRFEQLVSFLVPAEHARAILAKADTDPADLRPIVLSQMREHSTELLGALSGPLVTQNISGYALPAGIARFVNCNATGNPVRDDPVQMVQTSCSAKAGLYVQQGLYSGDLRYSHYILSTDRLDAWRFARRLMGLTQASGRYGRLRHVGPYACDDRTVRLKGFDAAVLVCSRSYRRLKGLYDFTVRVSSLDGSDRGFASHLDIYGVEFDPGMNFIKRYVDAMERMP